jgi:hypothetical protein
MGWSAECIMATNFSKVDGLVNSLMAAGLQSLGSDVKKRSQILAPKDTGALRQSAKVQLNSTKDTVTISYNTAYARRRHWENNLHPATRRYLTNALKSIKNLNKYFKKF